MTATGHKAVADAIAEQIKRRQGVHTEHTREVVKVEHSEQLPEDVVRAVHAAGMGTLELRAEVDAMRELVEMLATQQVEQLRAVLDRVEQVHLESVAADNELIGVLKGLAAEAKKARQG